MKLIATIEDDDDVQNVYANYDVDEATRELAARAVCSGSGWRAGPSTAHAFQSLTRRPASRRARRRGSIA